MEGFKKGGLRKKYQIRKIVDHGDGRITTKATTPGADYFVLRLDADPHARKAIIAYAKSVRADNPQLANEIEAKMSDHYGWSREVWL